MMLCYKAWRESRTRFFAGAILVVAYCAAAIVFTPGTGAPVRAVDHSHWKYFVDNQLFDGLGKMAFVLPVIFLGLGGLKRERAQHSAIFTLSFPVSRTQLVGAQIVVGLAELAFLAFLPALLIQPFSEPVHQSYPIGEALRFCFLRFLCGIEIISISFLLSVILGGSYTAAVACWVALLLQAQVANLPPLRPYGLNPLSTMGGHWLIGSIGSNINGPFPWIGLLILMLTAFGLIATATRITQKQSL